MKKQGIQKMNLFEVEYISDHANISLFSFF